MAVPELLVGMTAEKCAELGTVDIFCSLLVWSTDCPLLQKWGEERGSVGWDCAGLGSQS